MINLLLVIVALALLPWAIGAIVGLLMVLGNVLLFILVSPFMVLDKLGQLVRRI